MSYLSFSMLCMNYTRLKQYINLIIPIIFINSLTAQPGALDTTFSVDGKLLTPLGSNADGALATAIQADGKIIAAGFASNGANNDFALARYNTNGSLDNTFNTTGKVVTAIGTGNDLINSIAIQPDGKIVVAGWSFTGTTNDFALARYNIDGSLDNNFGINGKVTTAIGSGDDRANSLVIQSDGKIVVAGYSNNGTNNDFSLVRYNITGGLDTSFDSDGKLVIPIGTANDIANAVVLQSDGKIVVAGYTEDNPASNFALIRCNINGSLDSTFNLNGKLIIRVGVGTDIAYSVAIQPDSKIVVAGYLFIGTNADFALVRLNNDGSLDNSFNLEGTNITPIGTANDFARAVVIQPDGKIVVAGYAEIGTKNSFALARYNTNGRLDMSFGINGKVITAIDQGNDEAYAIALQRDGKIVVVGRSFNGIDNDFALARYIPGLSVGIKDIAIDKNSLFIYPNPIESKATFEYTLMKQEDISIYLVDSQGKILKIYIENDSHKVGKYKQEINLPEELSKGMYFIVIMSPNGQVGLQVIK